MVGYISSVLRFGLLSALSFLLTLLLTTLLVKALAINPLVAHIVTLVTVMVVNLFLLTFFVFPIKKEKRQEFARLFIASSCVFRIAEWVAFAFLIKIFNIDYQVSIIIVNPSLAFLKFTFLKWRAYATPKNLH